VNNGPRRMDIPGSVAKRIHVSFFKKKLIIANNRPSQGEVELQEAREQEQPFIQNNPNNETQNFKSQSNTIQTNEQTNSETSVIPNEGQQNNQEFCTIASSLFLMMATHLERIRNEQRQTAPSPISLISEVFRILENELIQESRNQSTNRP
jgi:hypothetical protein